jgi:hypothetical protein
MSPAGALVTSSHVGGEHLLVPATFAAGPSLKPRKPHKFQAPCNATIRAADDSGPRPRSYLHCIVLHETGANNDDASTAAYFRAGHGAGSTQLIVDDDSCYRTLPDLYIPWGAPPMNTTGLHTEIEASIGEPLSWWSLGDHERRLRRVCWKAAKWVVAYSIPVRFAWYAKDLPSNSADFHGITVHAAISDRYHESTHQDGGEAGFPRDTIEKLIRAYVKELKAA